MEPEGSSPHSQEPATCPYPRLHKQTNIIMKSLVLTHRVFFIIVDNHQQNAQITNNVQSAPYHKQTLHMFRLSMSTIGKPLRMAHTEPKHM
jgi:hypothetical protein